MGSRRLTPATARTVREALGLSTPRLAALLGLASERDLQRAEAGGRAVGRRHAALLIELESRARSMLDAAAATVAGQAGDLPLVAVRYRRAGDMLAGTAPEPFELHGAVLAALRLRLGGRLAVAGFDPEAYAAWRGDRPDGQDLRAAWAAGRI